MFDLAYDYARGEGMKHYVEKFKKLSCCSEERLHLRRAHQQEGHRLFRPSDYGYSGWPFISDCTDRFYRRRAVFAVSSALGWSIVIVDHSSARLMPICGEAWLKLGNRGKGGL